MTDMVNSPPHYKTESGLEAIDVIKAFFRTNYNLGQVFKYIARTGKKWDALEDLKKARWYLDKEIEWREEAKDDSPAIRLMTQEEIKTLNLRFSVPEEINGRSPYPPEPTPSWWVEEGDDD